MAVPQIIQVMNYHNLVLEPMVTWGPHIWENPPISWDILYNHAGISDDFPNKRLSLRCWWMNVACSDEGWWESVMGQWWTPLCGYFKCEHDDKGPLVFGYLKCETDDLFLIIGFPWVYFQTRLKMFQPGTRPPSKWAVFEVDEKAICRPRQMLWWLMMYLNMFHIIKWYIYI